MANATADIRAIWPYKQADAAAPLPKATRGSSARRGIGLRASTTFPVLLCEGPHAAQCRALELSATGIVVDRGRELSEREQRASIKLELYLTSEGHPVRALARVVRRAGPTAYALKFVLISDVDRLTLMEHLDRERLDSLKLLDEVEHANDVQHANVA